jgi:hypothetical protein
MRYSSKSSFNNAFIERKSMKRSIALIALAISGSALAENVCLVNWSTKYNIAILSSSGKWVQLAPRTRTGLKAVDIDLTKDLALQACDKGQNKCGFSSSDFSKTSISYPISKVNVKKNEFRTEGVTLILDAGYSMFDGLSAGSGMKTSTSKTVRAVSLNESVSSADFQSIIEKTQAVKTDLNESLRLMTVDVSKIKSLNTDQMFMLFGIDPKQPINRERVTQRYNQLKQTFNPNNYGSAQKNDAVLAISLIDKVYEAIIKSLTPPSKPAKPAAPISNEDLKAMNISVGMVPKLNNDQLLVLFGADASKDLTAIKSRYKKLMLKFHTDKYQETDKELAKEASQVINAFYDTLDTSRSRAGND